MDTFELANKGQHAKCYAYVTERFNADRYILKFTIDHRYHSDADDDPTFNAHNEAERVYNAVRAALAADPDAK